MKKIPVTFIDSDTVEPVRFDHIDDLLKWAAKKRVELIINAPRKNDNGQLVTTARVATAEDTACCHGRCS